MLEGNEEVVLCQVRAGNVSSGRSAGQCARQQKKRDAPEPPSIEEAEVVPLRFNGTLQPGWDFLQKNSLPPPPAPAPATAASASKKVKVSHEKMALKWSAVQGWRDGAMATAKKLDHARGR